jgi:hypothetical protein
MSFKDDFKNIIPPNKELRDYMEWVKRRPRPDPETMEAQFRRFKKYRESREYQDEERLEQEAAKRFTEDWHKKHGV